ncbi:MAG: carboxylesterase family protein [Bacilli bacterium]
MSNILINTNCGSVKGKEVNGVYRFLGVPYAEETKRFKRCIEIKKYKEEISCLEPKGSCFQFGGNFDGDVTPNQGEDCLNLNVFTNGIDKKKPVFVWIHGGGFMTGCSYYPMYDGSAFAKEDIVYVAINYRLGVLGFYDFSKFGKEFESNVGINDQIVALNWIKHNISFFGGDPNNITICGESAGGISVLALLASPKTEGLFKNAIVESSLPYCIFDSKEENVYTNTFLNCARITKKNINQLYKLSLQQIFDLTNQTTKIISKKYPGFMINSPVIDDILPYDVMEAQDKKINKDVNLIIGTNRDEGTLFCQNSPYSIHPYGWVKIKEMLDRSNNSDLYLPLKKYYDEEWKDYEFHQFAYDNLFVRGMLNLANKRSSFNKNTYIYRFDFSLPKTRELKFNACHALEMSFVLGTTDCMIERHPFFKGCNVNEVKEIEKQMHSAWVSFVKYGNPNKKGLNNVWPRYDNNNPIAYVFNLEPSLISYKDYAPLEIFGDRRIFTK